MDPITFEVLRNAFAAVCNEMALVVAKTAYSTPVNEGHDFAGAVYDRHGRLVAQGELDLPTFVGLTMLTVPEVIRSIGLDNMQPGDIYMINDPYVASTHNNDMHLVKPVFWHDDLIGFVTSTAHWSDVGGSVAGSLSCMARSQYEEGMRVPAVTLYERGLVNQDVVSLLLLNMRQSWERLGDLNAQVAAVNAGEQRLHAVVDRHGLPPTLQTMAEIQNHSERLARAAFTRLPDGDYHALDRVDQDPLTGVPVTIRLTLTIDGDHALFDLTASDDEAEASINSTIAATTSAIFIGIASVLPKMPINAGVMRAVEIKARRRSIVWAQPPAGVSGLVATSQDIVITCTINALSQALPERGAASSYGIINSVFAGYDSRPDFDAPFINYVWGFGGLGGTKYKDGANDAAPPFGASAWNIPVELQERRYPVLWRRNMLLTDSGGPGRSRGGLGLDQLFEFPYHPGTLLSIGNRERFGPPGIFDGAEGGKAGLVINRGSEQERNLGVLCVDEPVAPGETADYWSSGGGGYGDPLDRSIDKVLDDLIDGYISLPAARDRYGLVLRTVDPRRLTYEVDAAATAALRDHMHATRD